MIMTSGGAGRHEQMKEDQKKRTVETTGTITHFESHRYATNSSFKHYVEYQFNVNGATYNGQLTSSVYHSKGEESRICYEPSNPQNSQLLLSTEKLVCGQ